MDWVRTVCVCVWHDMSYPRHGPTCLLHGLWAYHGQEILFPTHPGTSPPIWLADWPECPFSLFFSLKCPKNTGQSRGSDTRTKSKNFKPGTTRHSWARARPVSVKSPRATPYEQIRPMLRFLVKSVLVKYIFRRYRE